MLWSGMMAPMTQNRFLAFRAATTPISQRVLLSDIFGVVVEQADRFDRQVRFFGLEGQNAVRRLTVTLVGVGGTGSHVAQQLGYLGVRQFGLIDPDGVSASNLNRLVGGTRADAEANRPKVEVAERLIRTIEPDAEVSRLVGTLKSEQALALIGRSDFVFGCVDNDASRLVLNHICQAFTTPYIDLASDIHLDAGGRVAFGGRTVLTHNGQGCLVCLGMLDLSAVRLGLMTERQRNEHRDMYGVPPDELGTAGPSVISLNGVISSLAVTEFLMYVTGIRPPRRVLEYVGTRGIVVDVTDPPEPDCYYCTEILGSHRVDLSQFV
jgi:molybdopterin-synthase adenylyltransferase